MLLLLLFLYIYIPVANCGISIQMEWINGKYQSWNIPHFCLGWVCLVLSSDIAFSICRDWCCALAERILISAFRSYSFQRHIVHMKRTFANHCTNTSHVDYVDFLYLHCYLNIYKLVFVHNRNVYQVWFYFVLFFFCRLLQISCYFFRSVWRSRNSYSKLWQRGFINKIAIESRFKRWSIAYEKKRQGARSDERMC